MRTHAVVPPGALARLVLLAAAVALGLAVIPSASVTAQSSDDKVTRLSNGGNVESALAFSQATFADGSSSDALIARDDVFADSLASGAAQGLLNAPLLLTSPTVLDPRVQLELERLGVDRVHILGGSAAVSAAVETQLETLYEVNRLSGPTRIETAIAVASDVAPNATTAVIARAYSGGSDVTQAFADSLATGAFSAGTAIPVLYTETERLTGTTRAYLESSAIERVFVAGGTDAVSAQTAQQIEGLRDAGIEVFRLAGPNRAATAVAMATDAGHASAGASNRVILLEGADVNAWAAGFAAASQAGGAGAPVVLSAGADLPPETQAYLADGNGRIPLLCGPTVDPAACDAAASAMGL